jgi:hypothetical protein
MRCLAVLVLLLAAPPGLTQQVPELEPDELLRRADAARHALAEGILRIRVVVREPDQPPVESELDVYIQGAASILCVFRTGKFQDRKVLIREDLGKVWLLAPGTSRAIPITANQILVGGASIADIARRRLFGAYDAVMRPEPDLVDGAACRVLDLTARSRKTTYASAVWWIGESDGLPRKARLSLRSGKESKEIRFLEYDENAGRPRLLRMEIDHLLRKERGMVTTLEFLDYQERALDSRIFEPEGARRLP